MKLLYLVTLGGFEQLTGLRGFSWPRLSSGYTLYYNMVLVREKMGYRFIIRYSRFSRLHHPRAAVSGLTCRNSGSYLLSQLLPIDVQGALDVRAK